MPPSSATSSPASSAISVSSTRRSTRCSSSDWPLPRIDITLRAILRSGAYELKCRADVPARVVISEYVDVAKAFFDADVQGMVNGVLDALARVLRPAEFMAPAARS